MTNREALYCAFLGGQLYLRAFADQVGMWPYPRRYRPDLLPPLYEGWEKGQ